MKKMVSYLSLLLLLFGLISGCATKGVTTSPKIAPTPTPVVTSDVTMTPEIDHTPLVKETPSPKVSPAS
jgi:PBP1b-binding outer membrane lipoprotein LpoB